MRTWQEIRQDFPILQQNIVYLDNAATSQKPKSVITAIQDLYQNYNANVHRGLYKISEEATARYTDSKKVVASFLHAPSYKSIVYTKNTTESINMACLMLEKYLEPNDEIIVSIMEHHSNMIPWQELAKRVHAKIHFVTLTEDFTLSNEHFSSLLNERTKIVALTHVSNVLGTINPLKEIIALLKDKPIYTVIDGAQAVGHLPVDVEELDVDFYAFSGHKLCAPTGIGVLYIRESLLNALTPIFYGGEMVANVTTDGFTYNENPWKFEAGTPNFEGGIALGEAITYINAIGVDAIEERNDALTNYFLQKARLISGFHAFRPQKSKASSVISFSLNEIHPHDIAQLLDKENICIRAGMHCAQPLVNSLGCSAFARVSLHFYNNEDDIDTCITRLQTISHMFSHG